LKNSIKPKTKKIENTTVAVNSLIKIEPKTTATKKKPVIDLNTKLFIL